MFFGINACFCNYIYDWVANHCAAVWSSMLMMLQGTEKYAVILLQLAASE